MPKPQRTPTQRVEALRDAQQAKLAEVRVEFPEFAEWVDAMRATFPGAKLQHLVLPDGTVFGEPFIEVLRRKYGSATEVHPSDPPVRLIIKGVKR